MKLGGITMVHHHVCYEEIHGYDLVILMPKGEHFKLHYRLRKEDPCQISLKDLRRISNNSTNAKLQRNITNKKYNKNIKTKNYSITVGINIVLKEIIRYNIKTDNITVSSGFYKSNY